MIDRLAQLRQSRNIQLEDVAAATKIAVARLRAIEEGHYERLPGGVYNVSYLRQYARVVGLDEDALVSEYYTKTGETAPVLPAPVVTPPPVRNLWRAISAAFANSERARV